MQLSWIFHQSTRLTSLIGSYPPFLKKNYYLWKRAWIFVIKYCIPCRAKKNIFTASFLFFPFMPPKFVYSKNNYPSIQRRSKSVHKTKCHLLQHPTAITMIRKWVVFLVDILSYVTIIYIYHKYNIDYCIIYATYFCMFMKHWNL